MSLELQKELKKNGKGFKHRYYRTEDIEPKILQKCKENNVGYKPWWEDGEYILYVFQTDKVAEPLKYNLPFAIKEDSTPEKTIQLIGKAQTYYKRYLLIQAFCLCEDDEIEHIDPDKPKKFPKRKPQKGNLSKAELLKLYENIKKQCEFNNSCMESKIWACFDSKVINEHDREILLEKAEHWGGVNM